MKLRSKNPYDHPRIIPNYATHPEDLVPIIEAFKIGEKWAEHLQEYNATIVVNDVPGCQHTEKGWFSIKNTSFVNSYSFFQIQSFKNMKMNSSLQLSTMF